MSAQEDAMAEEGEARAAVYLALDQIGLLFTPSVPAAVVRQGEGGIDCDAVLLEALVKACRWGRSSAWAEVIQVLSRAALSSAGSSSPAKRWTRSARAVISGQAVRAASIRSR